VGFRFRRSVRIAKGVRLNFGARGTSVSVGGRGVTVNFSRRGTRTTVGIPGTGISYSETEKGGGSGFAASLVILALLGSIGGPVLLFLISAWPR
jgi:hypothetical protein